AAVHRGCAVLELRAVPPRPVAAADPRPAPRPRAPGSDGSAGTARQSGDQRPPGAGLAVGGDRLLRSPLRRLRLRSTRLRSPVRRAWPAPPAARRGPRRARLSLRGRSLRRARPGSGARRGAGRAARRLAVGSGLGGRARGRPRAGPPAVYTLGMLLL